jgi:hypothetical protein
MPCPYEVDVSTFSDGELPEARAERVREHLAGCGGCADFLLFCWWLDWRAQEVLAHPA